MPEERVASGAVNNRAVCVRNSAEGIPVKVVAVDQKAGSAQYSEGVQIGDRVQPGRFPVVGQGAYPLQKIPELSRSRLEKLKLRFGFRGMSCQGNPPGTS